MTAPSRRTLAGRRRTSPPLGSCRRIAHRPWLCARATGSTARGALVERAAAARIIGLRTEATLRLLTLRRFRAARRHGATGADARRSCTIAWRLGGTEMLDLRAGAQLLAAIRPLLTNIRLRHVATGRPGMMRARRPSGIPRVRPRPGIVDVAALHRRSRADPLGPCRSRRTVGRHGATREPRACRRRVWTAHRCTRTAGSRSRTRCRP